MGGSREARVGSNRAALEKNRQVILKTQKICGICGQPVDFSYKYPHPLSPTVDHIIPIAKGGHPSALENLQLSHRYCNRQKSDKFLAANMAKEKLEKNAEVDNDNLPQHFDWEHYRG